MPNNKKLKHIKLINPDMKFVDVHIETLDESDVFDLIRSGRLTKQDFAAWSEHQRDEWLHFGMNMAPVIPS
jgi:hypothetical protein